MAFDLGFILTNSMLGVGLAMDAFSVSLANGLNEPCMRKGKMCTIASVFAIFQALMPLIGWGCIHTVAQHFQAFATLIPWIALALLGYIGGKMIYEGIQNKEENPCTQPGLGFSTLCVQGIATSIDALSVGFAIADYGLLQAIMAALLIAAVTFVVCFGGVLLGRKAGTKLAGKAGILGGVILIIIGIEIFLTGVL